MAIPITPLINGKSYEWSDISLVILGVPIIGIVSVEYGDEQEMENNYGAGSRVTSRGYGKEIATAKITLLMEEVENIQAASLDGRLQSIPEFDIPVVYLDESLVTRNHVIKNVRFKNNKRVSNQGEQSIPVELDLLPSHIVWNG